MELGINDFTILLIKILNQREIQDYQIAEYLEKIYKNNENYSNIAPEIIFELKQNNNEKKEKNNVNEISNFKRKNYLFESMIFVNETSNEEIKI